jgi:prolyl-tRNA editing enzyme YbaK/EbsC (Cys-tRNA(Pro) deacylase)
MKTVPGHRRLVSDARDEEVEMTQQADHEAAIGLVTAHLEELGIPYEVIEHPRRYTAADEARAAGVTPDNAAKAVLLRGPEGFRLAVVPASERVDMHKLRALLEAGKELRLASEAEMATEFPGFELGAIPPLGAMLPAAEIVDRRLLDHERVLCNGGDHEHSVLLDPRDLVRVSSAVEADICAE